MSAAGLAADKITAAAVDAAGWMLVPAYPFPPTKPLGMLLPIGKGAPGTLAEGGRSWLNAANELQAAVEELRTLVGGLSADDWGGEDRRLFDHAMNEWTAQLAIGEQYARTVGTTLAAQALALAPYGGFCLAIGGVMLAEGLAFDAAVASVVGNVGVSEAIYAEATAVGFGMLAGLAGYLSVLAMLMSTSALLLKAGALDDAIRQRQHGDTDAPGTLAQAEVRGLGGAAKNLEAFAAGVGGNLAAGALGARVGVAQVGIEGHAINKGIDSLIGTGIGRAHDGAVDAVTGRGPIRVLTDLTGVSGVLDDAGRLLHDGVPATSGPADVQYSLPAPAAVAPLPTAPPGGPDVAPIPNAEVDDDLIVPAASAINGVTPG